MDIKSINSFIINNKFNIILVIIATVLTSAFSVSSIISNSVKFYIVCFLLITYLLSFMVSPVQIFSLLLVSLPINTDLPINGITIRITDLIILIMLFKFLDKNSIQSKTITKCDILVFLFLIGVILTIPFSIDKKSSIEYSKILLESTIVYFGVTRLIEYSKLDYIIRSIVKMVIFETIIILIFSIYKIPGVDILQPFNYVKMSTYSEFFSYMKVKGIYGTFNHHNIFSGMIVLEIPFIFYYKLYMNKSSNILIILNILFLILSASRSGWIGFIVQVILFSIYFEDRKIKRKVITDTIGISLLLSPFIINRASNITANFQGETVVDRFVIWKLAISFIPGSLIIGKGRQAFYYLTGYNWFSHAHNLLLELIISYGLAETIIFSLIYVYVIYNFNKSIRHVINTKEKTLIVMIFISLMGFIVHEFFDIAFLNISISVLFYFTLGIFDLIHHELKRKQIKITF